MFERVDSNFNYESHVYHAQVDYFLNAPRIFNDKNNNLKLFNSKNANINSVFTYIKSNKNNLSLNK